MEDQEEILLSLVRNAEGRSWAKGRAGWNEGSDVPVCRWDGIGCDPIDRETVTGIFLPSSDLVGTVPSELGRLATLRSLELPQNLLHGTLPAAVAELPHLETVVLNDNDLSGSVPKFLSPLLKKLDLSSNAFSGRLRPDVGERHERLESFDLSDNRLSGAIPSSFGEMEALDTLSLTLNYFSGTIPSSLGRCPNLRFLFLDHNELVGTIPPQLARTDSALAELWLQNNALSGTIPAAFSDSEDLFSFYVDGNKLTGTVPKALCEKELNEDFFRSSNVHAKDRDYCEAVSCPVGSSSLLGVFPCVACDDVHDNPYLGSVGECTHLDQWDILQMFYNATDGDSWKNLPVPWSPDNDYYCSFTGVTCDKNKNILKIELPYVNLQGTIPTELGLLRYLEVLDLSDNHLKGFLPSDLRFPPLLKLDVSGNRLRGVVPPMLCLKPGLNGNGDDGEFDCRRVACPVGTYSATGLATPGVGCAPCDGSDHLAATTCDTQSGPVRRGGTGGRAFAASLGIAAATFAAVAALARLRRRIGGQERVYREEQEIADLRDSEFD